jgi:hypothetical protein
LSFNRTAAKAAAHRSWSRTPDRTKRTAPARAAQEARLENEVDPDHQMSAADRAKAVENLRQAKQLERSLKGVAARQRKREQADQ